MMRDKILLISKDATIPEYFEPYGGKYWRTPNISELASKGTVFKKHYTVAPSTAMAFIGMFTGRLPLETDHSVYDAAQKDEQDTLFDELNKRGYQCHLLWSSNYVYMAEKYSRCYGKNTIHHDKIAFNQSVGQHKTVANEIVVDDNELAGETLNKLLEEIDTIDFDGKVFLWIHMPHVFLGRSGYGRDIDIFDSFVGEMRKRFPDEGIYITADHGHMNNIKGKTCYGFDVYEPAIRIPLITPRIGKSESIEFPTSNVQLKDIILNQRIKEADYIVSDSAYYAQPFRKIAVIHNHYKYIYNKKSKKEELYDLDWDPHEDNNLLTKYVYDEDRQKKVIKEQVCFYPYYDQAMAEYNMCKQYFESIWKTGTTAQELRNRLAIPYRRVRTLYRDFIKEIQQLRKDRLRFEKK